MKNWIFEFILYIFSFAFVDLVFDSLVLPEDSVYLFLTILVVGLAMMLAKPMLTFLTVKVTFLTRLLAIFLLIFAVFYLLELFVPGFQIELMVVPEVEYSWVSIKSFEFDKITVMALLSFLIAFLSSLVKFLDES